MRTDARRSTASTHPRAAAVAFPRGVALVLPLLTIAIGCVSPSPGWSAERNRLIVRGYALDGSGLSIKQAWILTRGSRRVSTYSDEAGSFALIIPWVTPAELAHGPFTVRIQARAKGWRLALVNGEPELALELRVVPDSAGGNLLRVRSNDPDVAARIASDAFTTAGSETMLELQFVGVTGVQRENAEPKLRFVQETAWTGPSGPATAQPSTRPVTPSPPRLSAPEAPQASPPSATSGRSAPHRALARDTSKSASRVAAKNSKPTSRSTKKQRGRIRVADGQVPDTSAAQPDAESAGDQSRDGAQRDPHADEAGARERRHPTPECSCQISGTVEVVSDRPLPSSMRVAVFLEDAPHVQDSVELFMGSPRSFELHRVPCGQHRIGVRPRSKQRFILTSPESDIDCKTGGTRQVRVVLRPAPLKWPGR